MIEELIAAATVGASLGNAWVCALISLGCSIESKRSGVAFVAGRFLGLVVLGSAIAGLGLVEGLNPVYFLVLFGVLTVLLGIAVLLQALGVNLRRTLRHLGLPIPPKHRHGGECEKQLMADGGEVQGRFTKSSGAAYVLLLGIIRGATPCVKTMVLAPLLVSVDFGLAIGMVLVFAAASTMYPVIGFLSGNILRQSRKYSPYLRIAAALLMIVIGVYFVVNAFVGTHNGAG